MKKEANQYKSNIWKIYFFQFFHHLHFFAGILVPFFTIWGGIKFSQIMILQAIFTFSMFLLEVPTGVIADKFGRKTSLFLSGIAGMIACLVYASYANFWIFALGEFLWALGATLTSGADQAFVYDSLKQVKQEKLSKKIYNRLYTISLIAIMVSGPIGSMIAKYFGLRAPMLFTAIPFLIMALVTLSFKEPPFKDKKKKEGYFSLAWNGIKYFKSHKILKILAFDFISIYVLSFFIIWIYQVVLQSYNVNIQWFGFVNASLLIGEIFILWLISKFEKLFKGKKLYLFLSAIIAGLSYLLIAFASNVYIAIIGIILVASFGITRKPIYQSYFNKFIKSHNRATVLSAISMIVALITAMSNIVWGYLTDWNLKYTLIFIGILIIVFSFLSRVKEEHLAD